MRARPHWLPKDQEVEAVVLGITIDGHVEYMLTCTDNKTFIFVSEFEAETHPHDQRDGCVPTPAYYHNTPDTASDRHSQQWRHCHYRNVPGSKPHGFDWSLIVSSGRLLRL